MKHSSAKAGAMVSLNCSQDRLEAILNKINGYAVVANINSPRQMVLSGERSAIESAMTIASQNDIRFQRLPVSNAFHSRLAEKAAKILALESSLPETLPNLDLRLFSSVEGQEVLPGLSLRKHFADQDYDAALIDVTRAIELAPENGEAYKFRAILRMVQSNLEGTIDDLTTAIELEPNSPGLLRLRATARRRLGQDDQADANLKQANQLDPVRSRNSDEL